jgi:hypothetical protein
LFPWLNNGAAASECQTRKCTQIEEEPKYGELVTPGPGRTPLSDRPDSSANHRNLKSWWSAEFSAVWAYIPNTGATFLTRPSAVAPLGNTG